MKHCRKLHASYGTVILFGNPAVFPLRGDPWLCDPASQRVCRFDRRCLVGSYPNIASPLSDNGRHNNPGQQTRRPLSYSNSFAPICPVVTSSQFDRFASLDSRLY